MAKIEQQKRTVRRVERIRFPNRFSMIYGPRMPILNEREDTQMRMKLTLLDGTELCSTALPKFKVTSAEEWTEDDEVVRCC